MRLHYHSWRSYQDCPKQYFLKYRKKVQPTVPINDYFTLYGKLMEKFFINFSTHWKFETPYMTPNRIREKIEGLWEFLEYSSIIDWSAPFAKLSAEDIIDQAFQDTCTIMDSHNQNYFLNTKSEVEIKATTKNGVELVGRLDFLYNHPLSNSVMIFDGKGTKHVGKYVSEDQLLFYALLYLFHYKRLPDELGFFYYRFNSMIPVDITSLKINHFRERLSSDIKKMLETSDFPATPCYRSCKFCDYNNSCNDRSAWQASHRKPSQINVPDEPGVQEFGF